MKLTGKNILLISPEPWDHIFVSKHHYARHLAERGNQVFFANPPKDTWASHPTDTNNLQVLDYPRFIKGLRKLPSFILQRLIRHKLHQIEQYCELQFDIIWSFDNSVFFDFTLLDTFNISHIVDLNQDFETEKAAQTADICFYTTEWIGEVLKQHNPNTHFINHGYNARSIPEPIKLPGEHTTKVLYAGNLNMPYLDWEHMHDAILNNPQADFIFIGPLDKEQSNKNSTWNHIQAVLSHKRSYFLGRVPADDLASYYASADVLTICYQEKHHDDQANPHKMMEYLASGKPILATDTLNYRQYAGEIIVMCKSNGEFNSALINLVTNYEFYNSKKLVVTRKAIAQDNTYSKQIERIETLIEKTKGNDISI